MIRNEKAYDMKHAKEMTLIVKVKLDSVPGAFHQIGDHVSLLFCNPYVQSCEVLEKHKGE